MVVEGYRIYGSPWSSFFYDWGFNLRGGNEAKSKWSEIKEDTEILITHGPALGFGDKVQGG